MTHNKRRSAMTMSSLLLFLGGCAATIVGDDQPKAVEMTVARAKVDLKCPEVGALVLSEDIVAGSPADGSQYTIGVSGCGREAIYEARCTAQKDCTVVIHKGQDEEFEPEVVP